MDYLKLFNAFWVGGIFCAIAQIFIDKTKLTPARIMVGYVVVGVILTAFKVYEPIINFAGCGASVPIIGFGYTLAKGVEKAVKAKGLFGVLSGGVTATAVGVSAAIFFGFICSLIFKPKGKR